MSSVGSKPGAIKNEGVCRFCQKPIIKAFSENGAKLIVERVKIGLGRLTLQGDMFEGPIFAYPTRKPSGFRRHYCKPGTRAPVERAFSASSFEGKRR